ncbi:hypothetical protein BGE01nite_31070 [Brevifollis gellanilyticus]|uniref:Nuclear transport factor 2 family protein n=2 Tax=Brevifollis gellanilyticus TaxID=748831 RepID=A0A512MAQ2_9BACT|nr:hypothetical protein BGE01nite_31070 [Brevifollis gellanilyticus]
MLGFMSPRSYIVLGSVILLISLSWFGWWAFGRSPADQIRDRQQAFLLALEERDWDDVKAMLTDDYADDYGHDRDSAVQDAQQALGSFLSLTIKPEIVQLQAVPGLAMVKMKIRVEGKGLGISDMVVAQVNSIEEPWFFHWHKKGPWPWDWRIVQIHNDGLHVPQL